MNTPEQVTPKGTTVPMDAATANKTVTNPMTNNMTVSGGPTLVVKKLDTGVQDNRKDPVATSMEEIKNSRSPREAMRQAPLSGKQAPSAPPMTYPDGH